MSTEMPRVNESPKPVIYDPFPISEKAAEKVFDNIARDRKSFFSALDDKFLAENPALFRILFGTSVARSKEKTRYAYVFANLLGYSLIDTEASMRGGTVAKIREESMETYVLDLFGDAEGTDLSGANEKFHEKAENFFQSEKVLGLVIRNNLSLISSWDTPYVVAVLMNLFSIFKTHAQLVKTNRLLENS